MKKLIAFLAILICIFSIYVVFEYNKVENVLLVGDLIGFQISSEKNSEEKEIIPTSYNSIGTMSFIKKDTDEFVALGHRSSTENSKTSINSECYAVKLKCISKSNDNSIGATIGEINKDKKIGLISEDTNYGILGKAENINKDDCLEVQAVSRYKVKKGKANILTKISSDNLESFDVEITDINYFDDNMNIEIEITDENLISKTGGIIQGMSGTPLMQDGKLIGILNFAESKNSKKGYAIFVDKFI